MERKRFLDLCRQSAMKKDKIQVYFAKKLYEPIGYQLMFAETGKAKHAAILRDTTRNCWMYANLDAIEEAKPE